MLRKLLCWLGVHKYGEPINALNGGVIRYCAYCCRQEWNRKANFEKTKERIYEKSKNKIG